MRKWNHLGAVMRMNCQSKPCNESLDFTSNFEFRMCKTIVDFEFSMKHFVLSTKVTHIFEWRYQINGADSDENNDEQWLVYEWMNKLIWYFHFSDCSSISKETTSLFKRMNSRNCNIMKMNCGFISTSVAASVGRHTLKVQKQCQRTMCYVLIHTNVLKEFILNPLKLLSALQVDRLHAIAQRLEFLWPVVHGKPLLSLVTCTFHLKSASN